MSYSSRVYRQRNPKVQDEQKGTPFFPGKASIQKGRGRNAFFQAKPEDSGITKNSDKEEEKPVQTKMADQEKEREVNIPKQGDTLKEKEKTIQKAEEVKDEKENKQKTEPVKEDDKMKDMGKKA